MSCAGFYATGVPTSCGFNCTQVLPWPTENPRAGSSILSLGTIVLQIVWPRALQLSNRPFPVQPPERKAAVVASTAIAVIVLKLTTKLPGTSAAALQHARYLIGTSDLCSRRQQLLNETTTLIEMGTDHLLKDQKRGLSPLETQGET